MDKSRELPGIDEPKLISSFWQPGVYQYEGNLYERAVFRNETLDFFLGHGVYYQPVDVREWCGQHAPANSFLYLVDYANKFGEEKMLGQFESDINAVLNKNNFTVENLFFVISYITLYFLFFKTHKAFKTEWIVPDNIKQDIQQYLNKFIQLYGIEGGPFDCSTPRNEFFTQQTLASIHQLEEKFGLNLLNHK